MEYTQKAIDSYRKVVQFCKCHEEAKVFFAEEFKNSLDAADLLERQIKTYNSENEATITQPEV
jgi:hypothetical protein